MDRKDEIGIIAYQLWEENYCHGHDVEHWLKAETIWEKRKKQEAATIEPEKAVSGKRPKSYPWRNDNLYKPSGEGVTSKGS